MLAPHPAATTWVRAGRNDGTVMAVTEDNAELLLAATCQIISFEPCEVIEAIEAIEAIEGEGDATENGGPIFSVVNAFVNAGAGVAVSRLVARPASAAEQSEVCGR